MLERHLLSWPLPWLLFWPVDPAKEDEVALTAISSNKLTGVPNPESQFEGLEGPPEVITAVSSTLAPESEECFLTASNLGLRFILAFIKCRCWALRLWVHCLGGCPPEADLTASFSSLAMSGIDKWKRPREVSANEDLLLIGVSNPRGGLAAILGGEVTKKLECLATLWGCMAGSLEWG